MTNTTTEQYFNTICRLCTSTLSSEEAQEIFHNSENIVVKKIKICLQLKVNKDDKLPKVICKKCLVKLDEYYSYRESCVQAELILLRCLANGSSSPSFVHQNTIDENGAINGDNKYETLCKNIKRENNADENDVSKHDNDYGVKYENIKHENNLSDTEIYPDDNVDNTVSDEEEDDGTDEEKSQNLTDNTASETGKQLVITKKSFPKLGEPTPDDYVLMKEETFSLDPTKETNLNRGATSNVLADYLIEFTQSKTNETDIKDKDIMELQKLRREVLPPMWDVYEKAVTDKQDESSESSSSVEKEKRVMMVTHRRYIINKAAFPCSLCGECFEFDQGKKRDDPPEEKPKLYDCPTCGKLFPRRSSWKRHQNTHEDIKPYVCRLCNKGFNRKEHLTRHLLSHGTFRPFSCGVCNKQFIRKEHLNRHQLCNPSCAAASDNILRPFCCDVCSQGFVRKEHLQRHRKRAHDLDPTESDEPKPFTCYVCTKTFTRREHLRRHQLIHQRELTVNSSSLTPLQRQQLLQHMQQQQQQSMMAADSGSSMEFQFSKEVTLFPSKKSALLPEVTLSEVMINDSRANFNYDHHHHHDNEYDDDDNNNNNFDNTGGDDDVIDGNEYYNNDVSGGDGGIYMVKDEEDAAAAMMEMMEDEDDEEQPLPPIPVLEMNPGDDESNNIQQQYIDLSKSNTFCNVCFKNFSRRSHLLRHMKRIHHMQLPPSRRRQAPMAVQSSTNSLTTGGGDENGNSLLNGPVRKHACKECGKSFTKKSHLDRHGKTHKNKVASSVTTTIEADAAAQMYECVVCEAKFVQSKLLDKHMELHHGNAVSDNFLWM